MIVAIACTLVLAACGSPDQDPAPSAGSSPASVADTASSPHLSAGPTTPSPSADFVGVGSSPVPDDPPAELPPPFSDHETMVWIPAGDHRVPGTLALPAVTPGEKVPAVLLLHGDLSSRDENGEMFARLASALEARGIASLRIDFAGSGDSEEPDLALDYPGMVLDATASLDYLRQDADVDPDQVAILGLSRGAGIGATVTGTDPGVAAFVSWSGAVYDGYDEDPDGHEEARRTAMCQSISATGSSSSG